MNLTSGYALNIGNYSKVKMKLIEGKLIVCSYIRLYQVSESDI